jgi:hypothetical protein
MKTRTLGGREVKVSNSILGLWRANKATNRQAQELGGSKGYRHPFIKAFKVWFWLKTGNPEMASRELGEE